MPSENTNAFDSAAYYDCCDNEEIEYPNSPEECIADYIESFAPFADQSMADVVRDICPITVRALDIDDDADEEDYAQFGIRDGMSILKEVGSRAYSEAEVLAILAEEWGEDAY